ncbi:NADH-quinone oxidoreductase subunit NuoE [Gammaproteobacteria bacterium]|nr:NADH-quinone oxidoreductase subunit NuoE [Gammaproteobacteria bacterium]
MLIGKEEQKKIDHWIAKFPEGKAASAVLMALKIIQDRYGWLSDEALEEVAAYLSMSKAQVCEVASFYSMYRLKPSGQKEIKVCTSLSCCLNGATNVIRYLEKKLEIDIGNVTSDGLFSLDEAECLGACMHAPVVIVNDEHYHHQATPRSLDKLIDEHKHEAE